MKIKSFIAALVSAAVILGSCPFVSLADTEPEEIETEVPEEFDLPDDGVLDSGWYYVSSDWSYDTILTVSGTVNLILTNGNTLFCQGINVPSGSTLNIYRQRNDGGSLITASGRRFQNPTQIPTQVGFYAEKRLFEPGIRLFSVQNPTQVGF